MTMLFATLTSGFALILPTGSPAPAPWSTWAARSQTPLPRIPITLVLNENGCGGYDCSYPDRPRPKIVMFPDIDRWTRFEFLHELGHVYDFHHRTAGNYGWRTAVKRALGWKRWRIEQFAMAYTWCASASFRIYPGYDYWPTHAQHRLVCRAIRR